VGSKAIWQDFSDLRVINKLRFLKIYLETRKWTVLAFFEKVCARFNLQQSILSADAESKITTKNS